MNRFYAYNAMQARRRAFYRNARVVVGISILAAAYVVMAFLDGVPS